MKPKRVFQVYQGQHANYFGPDPKGSGGTLYTDKPFAGSSRCPDWRFRVLAPRAPVAHRIVGGSGEAFDSKSNAVRAARREASLYPPGVAEVVLAEYHPKVVTK